MTQNFVSSLFSAQNPQIYLAALLGSIISYLPRLAGGIILFLCGRLIANYLAGGLTKLLNAINLKKIVDSFELGITIPASSHQGLVKITGLLVRYIILYFTLILVFDLFGLIGISLFLKNIIGILPRVISAFFIIFLGIIAAGFIESLVKRAFLIIDPATARLSGKISSYVVIVFFVLMSLSELGLASFFINTLFVGFIAAISLAFGLSIGLGSKDVVSQTLNKWYRSRTQKK